MVVFREGVCIWAQVVVFGQKWFYLGNSGFCREKVVVFGKKCYIRAKVVVIGQSGCTWAKVVVFGQNWL